MTFTTTVSRLTAKPSISIGRIALAACLSACSSLALYAAVPSGAGSSLQNALHHYQALNSYETTLQTTTTLQPLNGSQPNVINSTVSLAFKSPNLMRINTQGLMGGALVVSDGKTLSSYSGLTNQYSVSRAPQRPLSSFLAMSQVSGASRLVGHATVNGKLLDEYQTRTAVVGQSATTTIYVDPASRLVQRVTVNIPKLSAPQGGGIRVTTQEDFTAQRLNPVLPASLFRFSPPAGAQRGTGAGLPTTFGIPGVGSP